MIKSNLFDGIDGLLLWFALIGDAIGLKDLKAILTPILEILNRVIRYEIGFWAL